MSEKSVVWTEKYRPLLLEDVIGRDKIVKRLLKYTKQGNMPNLLFAGSPGTGKTTTSLCLGHQIFGEYFEDDFTELNASDERGIGVVREKIKNIAGTLPLSDSTFKIILLDEADSLTNDAQSALRRTMEKFVDNCRFILSCNYSSKIIEPIQSRCAIYRFGALNDSAINEMINKVSSEEGIFLSDDGIEAIIYVARGDMRKAINTLQGASLEDGNVDQEKVYETCGFIDPEYVEKMINLAMKGKFLKARNELDEVLIDLGLSGIDVINQIYYKLHDMAIPDKPLIEMIDKVAETDFRIGDGANERIQLEALLACFWKIAEENKNEKKNSKS